MSQTRPYPPDPPKCRSRHPETGEHCSLQSAHRWGGGIATPHWNRDSDAKWGDPPAPKVRVTLAEVSIEVDGVTYQAVAHQAEDLKWVALVTGYEVTAESYALEQTLQVLAGKLALTVREARWADGWPTRGSPGRT